MGTETTGGRETERLRDRAREEYKDVTIERRSGGGEKTGKIVEQALETETEKGQERQERWRDRVGKTEWRGDLVSVPWMSP